MPLRSLQFGHRGLRGAIHSLNCCKKHEASEPLGLREFTVEQILDWIDAHNPDRILAERFSV